MITKNDTFKCDFCGEETGQFHTDTGNHVQCAELHATIGAQAAEITALKDALAYAMPHVHVASADGHDKTPWWHKCSQWQCERAYALLATPEPPTAPAPQPEPETLNEYQQAHAAVIVDGPVSATAWAAYEATKNRDLSSREKSGNDQRDGKHG